jgi:hypothetical protein
MTQARFSTKNHQTRETMDAFTAGQQVVLNWDAENPAAVVGTVETVYDDLPDAYFVRWSDGTGSSQYGEELAGR